MECQKNEYFNTFSAIDNATKVITDYLILNNENLWKLLFYIDPNVMPLEQPNLTLEQKKNMIATDLCDVNANVQKNFLFITEFNEAFSTSVPQVRIEIGDVVPTERVRGYMIINFQIIVPNKVDLFTASYNPVARRTDAILRELTKTLDGAKIPNSAFNGCLFMDRSAQAGRKTGSFRQQMNTSYAGRWVTFAVLI